MSSFTPFRLSVLPSFRLSVFPSVFRPSVFPPFRLTSPMPDAKPIPSTWLHHLADEADAAFLYRELARGEPDAARAEIYRHLAEVEDRHVAVWRRLLAEQGHEVAAPAPSRRARF